MSRHRFTTISTTTACPPGVSRITSLSGTSFAPTWRFSPQLSTSPCEPWLRQPGTGGTEARPHGLVGESGDSRWGEVGTGRCALTHPEWLNPPVRAGGLSHSGWVKPFSVDWPWEVRAPGLDAPHRPAARLRRAATTARIRPTHRSPPRNSGKPRTLSNPGFSRGEGFTNAGQVRRREHDSRGLVPKLPLLCHAPSITPSSTQVMTPFHSPRPLPAV